MTVYIKFIALVYAVNCIGYKIIAAYSAWGYYACIMLHKISLYECFIVHTFH